MSNKTIKFCLPDDVYNHCVAYLNETLGYDDTTPDEFLRCCVINRLIDLHILDEFGCPNRFVLPPKLELNTSDLNICSVNKFQHDNPIHVGESFNDVINKEFSK